MDSRAVEQACSCGHSWAYHNEYGCFVKHGHDEYCMCGILPPALVEKNRQARLARVLLYPCKDHKRYQVKRKPTVACEKCWRMYIEVNP